MSERPISMTKMSTGQFANASVESQDALMPFLIGAAVGGVAGAVVGTVMSQHTTHLVAALIGVVDRRLHEADRERLKFELLLQ
jgi:tetrahydromethanopterin S-methyltransferase subunit C